MRAAHWIWGAALAAVMGTAVPTEVQACGGFFCSQSPVDQNAERIIFKINADSTTDMIVQITYQGAAPDFAWVLPLAEVPDADKLATFPQGAMTALDAQTGPAFQFPDNCWGNFPEASAGADDGAGGSGPPREGGVDVYIRQEVGNYDVAVIGGEDPTKLVEWLRANDFRISDAMAGYVALYTKLQMKFLALKLLPEKVVTDITPFRLTLSGDSPSIPLRLTTVAAEPEMGIAVWIFADQRFGPANASEVDIDSNDLRWDPNTWQPVTNWLSLIAREVDKVGGLGWVVEQASSTQELKSMVENTFVADEDQEAARTALLGVLEGAPYMTRLYTRLSAEEMTYDPVFKRSQAGDVSRVRTLPYVEALCTWDGPQPAPSPCDFASCGALGLCREVENDQGQLVAACACTKGATARTTFMPAPGPDGSLPSTVACQDQRMSFLNPGDKNADNAALSDPCVGYDCGGAEHRCVAMNMTPTCECAEGFVARGWVEPDGTRRTTCVEPALAVPSDFYNRRPLPRDEELPAGREVDVPAPTGASDADDPMPEGNLAARETGKSGGGCSVMAGRDASTLGMFFGGLLGLVALRRRRAH